MEVIFALEKKEQWHKPDYGFKALVLQNGVVDLYRDYSKAIYNYAYGKSLKTSLKSIDDAFALESYMKEHNGKEWQEASRISRADFSRKNRLKKRIASMIQKPCCFLTFTFDDEHLNNTCADTRRQRVRRFLNRYNVPYVANIDFGGKNGREHYHAVVQVERVSSSDVKSYYGYGQVSFKQIRYTKEPDALAKYISKLTNHAIKETTKRSTLIYSRD